MFYIPLARLRTRPKNTLRLFDSCLENFHHSNTHFTPDIVTKLTGISADDAWYLTAKSKELGIVDMIKVYKCSDCKRIFKSENSSCNCADRVLEKGYVFTTNIAEKANAQ
jgi:DNA-directed RNA polymerase subunit RPC12/RpoP